MRKFVFVLAAVAAAGLTLPVISAQAEEKKEIIKEGRDHHRHFHRDHAKKIVIIKHRRRHHDHD